MEKSEANARSNDSFLMPVKSISNLTSLDPVALYVESSVQTFSDWSFKLNPFALHKETTYKSTTTRLVIIILIVL